MFGYKTHAKLVRWLSALLGSLAVASLVSAVPPNDDCADAAPITEAVTQFCTIGATTDGPDLPQACEEGFGLPFIADVWFSYFAPAGGEVCVSTCGVVDFDTRLAVYTGSCDSLVLVACNDDAPDCGLASELIFGAAAGAEYRIRLGGYSSRGCGSLIVSFAACVACPPSGHDCFAIGTPGCSDIDCCLSVCSFDPFCCAVEWDFMCVTEAMTSPACASTQYSCDGVENGVANDCAPYCLEVASFSSVVFDTTDATTDGPPTDCEYGKDIWYCVMAPGTGQLTVSVKDASFDPVVALYDIGTSTAFDPDDLPLFLLQCGDARTDGEETATVRTTASGHVYLIQVAGAASSLPGGEPSSGTGTLHVRFDVPLFSTGPTAAALYDPAAGGMFALTDVGFATGRLAPFASHVWFAQPITLPGDGGLTATWSVTELHLSGCVPGAPDCVAACTPGGDDCAPVDVDNQSLNVIIWSRGGTEPPTEGDQIAFVAVPFPQGNELVDSAPQNENLVVAFDPPLALETGDYYVTAYASSDDPSHTAAFTWLTNATGDVIPLIDGEQHPFAYRARSFPQPGFVEYALDASTQLAQQPGLDAEKLYAQGLALMGGPSGGSSCDRANTKLDAAAAQLLRAKIKTGPLPSGQQGGIQMLAQQIFAQNSAAHGLLQQAQDQLNAIGDRKGDECIQFDVMSVVNKLGSALIVLNSVAELTAALIADQDVTDTELAAAQAALDLLFGQTLVLIELIKQQMSGCPTDLTNDGVVDGADLATFLSFWDGSGTGDFNEDGVVNGADLAVLLSDWGPCDG